MMMKTFFRIRVGVLLGYPAVWQVLDPSVFVMRFDMLHGLVVLL